MDFLTFRGVHPAREPSAEKIRNEDELKLIPIKEGLQMFPTSMSDIRFSGLPTVYGSREHCYLWAIGASAVPFALESIEFGATLETGVVKHTNLTGGEMAHCGGELWFHSDKQLIVGGSSGRYGPKSEKELEDAVEAFRSEGYLVASLGFDDETGYPNTLLVGQPKWQ